MFSKIKKLKFSVVALVVVNLALFLFVIPSFTISLGETSIKYPEIDGNLLYPGSTVGNIREGRGLYATYQIRTTPNFEGIELTDEQKEAVYTDSLSRFQNRARTAGLYDVNIFRDNDAIVFEFPKYYQDIAGLTAQLSAKAKIDFISQDGATPLELYDYDIVGAVTQTYLPALGNHLVISFKSERLPQITSALSGDITQGYFYMNIDGQQAFFVAKTQYTNDPDTTMRLVPVSQNINTTKSLSIVKSYFTEKIASEYTFTQGDSITEVPANFPLNNLATQFIFGAVVVMLVTGAMFWLNKGVLGKRQLLIAVLFVLTTLALLKLSSAVISIATYVSMIILISAGVYLVYAYFKGEWYTKNIVRNLFLGLLGIVVILGPLTKNWVIYDFVGVLTAVLAAMIVSILVHQSVNTRVAKK